MPFDNLPAAAKSASRYFTGQSSKSDGKTKTNYAGAEAQAEGTGSSYPRTKPAQPKQPKLSDKTADRSDTSVRHGNTQDATAAKSKGSPTDGKKVKKGDGSPSIVERADGRERVKVDRPQPDRSREKKTAQIKSTRAANAEAKKKRDNPLGLVRKKKK